MTIKVDDVNIDVRAHMDKVQSDAMWTFAAAQWHKLYYPYVPYRTGTLADSVRITPGEIEHYTPYAHRQYVGHFNFRKDQHPLASCKWDRAAEPMQKPKLIQTLQRYIDSGRLKLDG